MTREPRVLPLVLRICGEIDQVFARYVGPISVDVAREEFERWRVSGQVGPLALHRYISRLAGHISNDGHRRAFIGEASKCIQVINGGKR